MCFSLFKKKRSVVRFKGNVEDLVWKSSSVVRFEGNVEDLVWKSPCVEIKAKKSVDVIVTEDYDAECSVDGVRRTHSGGRFTLSAGDNNADVEILYVRKESVVSLKWGTPHPIDIIDPVFEMPIRLGSSGEAKVSISDPQQFKKKLVAGARTYTEDNLSDFCRTEIATHLSSALSTVLKENGLSYFDISAQLVGLSYLVKERIEAFFTDYGLKLEHFLMATAKMWDEGALERLTADREFSRRYKEREALRDKLRAEQKQDKKDELDSQLELLRALGDYNSQVNESLRSDIDVTIVNASSTPHCKYCGIEIDAHTVFCPKCGKKVSSKEVKD